jgi:hypothetical protein
LNNSPAKTGLLLKLSGSIKGRAEKKATNGREQKKQKEKKTRGTNRRKET